MTTARPVHKPNRGMALLRSIARKFIPNFLIKARMRAAEVRSHLKYRGLPMERVFAEIYRQKEWGGSEGTYYSGTGSHDPAIVTPYVEAVRALLRTLPQKPIVVDLGSGDFNIGRHFVDLARQYYACDIVPDLQEYNRRKMAFPNVEFLCVNAVEHDLPDGDVVCIRQVLQHLSNAHIQRVMEKCRKYPRWIVTEHLPSESGFAPNADISAGCGFRILFNSGVVLTEPPFNIIGYSSRVLCEVPQYDGLIRTTLFERQDSI